MQYFIQYAKTQKHSNYSFEIFVSGINDATTTDHIRPTSIPMHALSKPPWHRETNFEHPGPVTSDRRQKSCLLQMVHDFDEQYGRNSIDLIGATVITASSS